MDKKLYGTLQSEICEKDGQYGRKISVASGRTYFIPGHLYLPYTDGSCEISCRWEHFQKELEIQERLYSTDGNYRVI